MRPDYRHTLALSYKSFGVLLSAEMNGLCLATNCSVLAGVLSVSQPRQSVGNSKDADLCVIRLLDLTVLGVS